MSIWNSMRSLLLSTVCVIALLLPHKAECEKKDKHKDKLKLPQPKTVEIIDEKEKLQYPSESVPEEKLTHAELKKKIATIRRHISAQNSDDEKKLLEAFDDLSHTQIGLHLLSRVPPELRIVGKENVAASAAAYSFADRCIKVNSALLRSIDKQQDEDLQTIYQVCLAQTLGHEMAHAEQGVFRYRTSRDAPKPSATEIFTEQKMVELHPLLIEAVVGNQVYNLPKYREKVNYDKVPETDIFFYQLKKAKMKEGADEKTADRFARSTFVETFWSNNPKTPVRVGKYKIIPPAKRMYPWNFTYNTDFFSAARDYVSAAKEDSGNDDGINHYINLMQIDTPASFFRDPEKTGFKIVSNTRFHQYTDRIKSLEIDTLDVGQVIKRFENGGIRAITFEIFPSRKSELGKFNHVEKYESGKVRAKYTCAMDGVHGTYSEFDEQGNQIMEVPVRRSVVQGEGWVREDGKRVKKQFYSGFTPARKAPRKRKVPREQTE